MARHEREKEFFKDKEGLFINPGSENVPYSGPASPFPPHPHHHPKIKLHLDHEKEEEKKRKHLKRVSFKNLSYLDRISELSIGYK